MPTQRRIPQSIAGLYLHAKLQLQWLTQATFLADLNLTNDPRITAILEAAQAFVLAVDAWTVAHTPTNKTNLFATKAAFIVKFRLLYTIFAALNVSQEVLNAAYGDLLMKNPLLNDTTKSSVPIPSSYPLIETDIPTGIFHVNIHVSGDSANPGSKSKAVPHKGDRRMYKIGKAKRGQNTVTEAQLNFFHLLLNDHLIPLDLTNHPLADDEKLVIVTCYVNAVGVPGPESPPFFILLPKWWENEDTKNKGTGGADDDSSDGEEDEE